MGEKVNENNFEITDASANKEYIKSLVVVAQSGDQNAFVKLLDTYEPLIRSMVSKFTINGMSDADQEDLRQEAVLAFYSSLVSYDPNISGVEFGLYAKVCICNRLMSQMRIIKRHISHSVSLYDPDNLLAQIGEYEDPAARILEIESERSLMRLINDNLSKYEQKVFRMYVAGDSASDMAKKLGSTEKSVNNAVYRIRKKLKSIIKK